MVAKDVKSTLTDLLRELRLPMFREHYETLARQAEQETLSYEQYLLELTRRECQTRQANRVETMLRQSRLPFEKTLEAFDRKRLPAKLAHQVRSLQDGTFVDRCENVLAWFSRNPILFQSPSTKTLHMDCEFRAFVRKPSSMMLWKNA